MLRILFIIVLLFHALIHLLGFLKAFNYAKIEQLLIPISKPIGLLWLTAAILMVFALLLYTFRIDWWWIPGAPAVLISQYIIILSWQDAKFGTFFNILFLIVLLTAYGYWSMKSKYYNDLESMYSLKLSQPKIVTQEAINTLPPIVQKWLVRSNVIGKEITQTVQLHQTGELRTSPDGSWMPITATQHFTVKKPSFVWFAEVTMNPFIYMTGKDKYMDGHGHMLIKVLSLIPVANAKGDTIDQSTMIRYLAECCWFPSSALADYLKWEELDSLSARVTMHYNGIQAEGKYTFTQDGDLKSFEALRFYERKDGATLERWVVEIQKNGYKEFQGIRIPVFFHVIWKLKEGDFTWLKLTVTDIAYNSIP